MSQIENTAQAKFAHQKTAEKLTLKSAFSTIQTGNPSTTAKKRRLSFADNLQIKAHDAILQQQFNE